MTGSSKASLTPQQIRRYAARLRGEQFRPLLPRDWQLERAIRKLTAAGTPEAIDPLCRFWMENGEIEDDLVSLLLDAGYAPSDPAERALFLILSGQLQLYEELDLDLALLTQAHATASPTLRKRLAKSAAEAGRMEWLGVMATTKPLNAFSLDDWATTVQVLRRAGDVDALWQWALKTPPIHSRALLEGIPAGTPPPAQFGEAAGLLRLAKVLPVVGHQNQLAPEDCTQTLSGHTRDVSMMAWSPDGRFLASCSGDETIRLWDPISGACSHILWGHKDWVRSFAWSPDGRCLASGSIDKTVRLWDPTSWDDPTSGACTRILRGHTGSVESIAWSPDGRSLASGSSDETVRLWDPTSGACTKTLLSLEEAVKSIAWSPDGGCLASMHYSTIRLWDPASGYSNLSYDHFNFNEPFKMIAWSPDGGYLASCNGYRIRLWSRGSGTCTRILPAHAGGVRSIAWSPDGRCLASGGRDKKIRLWDPASGACTHTFSGHTGGVRAIAWSPDGRCLASQCVDATNRLWHLASGACTHALSDHTGLVSPIAWSPDGRCLASSSWDKSIQLWNYDLYSLLTIPLSCYSIKHWSSLSALREQSMKLEDWQRPWLEFIAALSSLIHRFDVSLDNQSSKTASSNFDIEIDG